MKVVSEEIGFLVEPTDLPNDEAIGFAQISLFSEDFEQSVLVSWLGPTKLLIDTYELTKNLAVRLKEFVLFEIQSENDVWPLGSPDGSVSMVEVIEIPYGIDIVKNS